MPYKIKFTYMDCILCVSRLGLGVRARCEQALNGANWNLELAASALLEDPSQR